MKKTKLLTSIATLALVLSLGACEVNVDVGDVDVGVDVNPNDSSEPDEGGTTDTDTDTNPGTGEGGEGGDTGGEGGDTGTGSGGDENPNPGEDPNPGGDEGSGSTETTSLSNYTLSIGIEYANELVEVPEYATAYIQGGWDSWTNWVALTPKEGRYEYTFSSIEAGTYEYQLVLAYNDGEPGWTYRITQDGDNASFTVNASEGDSYTNEVTVTSSKALSEIIPDPNAAISNVKVTIDITYNGTSQGILDYGTLWIEGSWNWSEGFVACTVEDGKYVYTFDSLAPIEYEFLGVIYYSGEELPDETTIWDYKVNGSANATFTVSDASVSATLVATKALAEILPVKGGDEGGDQEEGGTIYKLGAADPATGVYYYFDGTALSTQYGSYLNVTTSWDEAAEVTITNLTDGGQSLSFIDSDGAKKYISWSSSTAVDFADEPYTWYWSDTINGFYNLADDSDTSGRFLGYYASTPSFRAYSPTEQYLAYGHVAAYTEEPEAITPEPEPEDEFPFEVGKDYFLGYDRSGTIYYYNGEVLNTYYGDVSTDISKAAKVTLGASGDKYTLKLENGKYLGAELGDHNNFKWDLDTAFEWEYNSTYQTFVAYNTSNTAYCLGTSGTYNEITLFTLSSAASNYPATLYEIPEDWAPYEEPEINEESFEEVKTGKLGLYQENKDAYYCFDGTKNGNFGNMSTNWDSGVEVTLLTDQTYYYIRFTSNGQTLYFGHTDSSNSQVALNSNPYPLQYDETHGAYLNTDGSRFLGTYSTYETLSWSEVSYINNSGQFIATIYETQPDLGGGDEGGNEGSGTEYSSPTSFTADAIIAEYPGYTLGSGSGSQAASVQLEGKTTTLGEVSIAWGEGGTSGVRLWSASPNQIRVYKGTTDTTISVSEGYKLESISLTVNSSGNGLSGFTVTGGTISVSGTSATISVTGDTVGLTLPSDGTNTYFTEILVYYTEVA